MLVVPAPVAERFKWADFTGHWLAVEIYSRGSRRYDHDYKRDAYLALGVREVWLVDLDERAVLVSRINGVRDERVTDTLRWHLAEMATDFGLPLAGLFAGL